MVNTDDLISLRKASEFCGLDQDHLAKLIRNGKLWGSKFGGRNWLTSKQAILEYIDKDRRPGPKPKR